jgi:hypothetical protein
MAAVARLLGIMTEDALSFREIPHTERLFMGRPPSFQRGVKFRASDAPGHLYCQRTFASDFWLLNLLTAQENKKAHGR